MTNMRMERNTVKQIEKLGIRTREKECVCVCVRERERGRKRDGPGF